ncbi:MAG: SUMF1/EgtB/PvdO family nonheme iron enzyme [Leptospiraceae bacterium]|nr:SUMF1/EgtB/PvdO family nonheme iron enzyme [Leptospiraceae bacterium]
MTDPFYLDKYEVTNRDYRRCVAAGKCQASETDLNPYFNKPEQPVLGVTWTDAYNYCRFVDKYLPTEAQWEYAAKAGTDAPRYFELNEAGHYENLRRFQHADVFVATAPVGTFRPNPWGLHDMLGNVSEWVFDPYDMEGVDVDPFEDNTGLTFEGDRLYRYASGKATGIGPGVEGSNVRDPYNALFRAIKGGDWWKDQYTATSVNRVKSLILYSISGSDDAGIIQLANGCPRMNVFVSDTSTDPFKCSMGRIEINLSFNPHILFKPERENAMTLNQFLTSSNLWDQASINRFYALFDNAFSPEASYLLFDGVKPGFRCAKD